MILERYSVSVKECHLDFFDRQLMSLLITFDIDAMEKDIVHSFSTVSSKVEVVCLVEGIGSILNFMEYVYSIQ